MRPKSLVIVESPTKAKTISRILGDKFIVRSSMGHIIDLPRKRMGVDIKNDFRAHYVVIPGKGKILSDLKKETENKEKVYLATDPDREGEAIGWHLKQRLDKNKEFLRVIFHEITKQAVEEAFDHPKDVDLNKVNAQQARRILDRIVGYLLSPLLWKKVAGGLSAGRVQSVAVKLLVEREREINNFIPQEYWEIEAELRKEKPVTGNQPALAVAKVRPGKPESFIAKLEKIEGEKAEIKNKQEAEEIIEELKDERFIVEDIRKSQKKRNPSPPFTTSTLQQEAFNKLKLTANKTMLIAQQLYEGIELGKEGACGLITYMRTDSVRVSQEALNQAREYILKNFGKDFLPVRPNIYKSKRTAQEAHEAIRPTSCLRTPEGLKDFLSPDQYKLYALIWNRFLASQMKPAVFFVTTVDITAGRYLLRARGSQLLFEGFTVLFLEKLQEEKTLPPLSANEILELIQLNCSQHFTKPPARYSDATLVKALEEKGIGRPSTYAPIIHTIVLRNYVRRQKGYLAPTELGIKVTELLIKYFPEVLNIKFTARLEAELDRIEEGRSNWIEALRDFYSLFAERLKYAQETIKKEVISTKEICDKCGKPMVIRWARTGRFMACSGFPRCKNTKPLSLGVSCPQPECDGQLVERRSKKGRLFYGCTNYPRCKYVSGKLPKEGD